MHGARMYVVVCMVHVFMRKYVCASMYVPITTYGKNRITAWYM